MIIHKTVQNLINIEKQIKFSLKELNSTNNTKIIAVSKTFKLDNILPLIEYGHLDYGENKVQEAIEKWSEIKKDKSNIQLHMIGRLQTNKVKFAVKLFDYIHTVDSEKLAKKIYEEELKLKKKIKIFIQVNIGDENQKAGVSIDNTSHLVDYCKKLNLNLQGLMCIPPLGVQPDNYFKKLNEINIENKLTSLSIGMSSDYNSAIKFNASFVRIGSNIFGKRD